MHGTFTSRAASFLLDGSSFISRNDPSGWFDESFISAGDPFIWNGAPFISADDPFGGQHDPFIRERASFIWKHAPFMSDNDPFIWKRETFRRNDSSQKETNPRTHLVRQIDGSSDRFFEGSDARDTSLLTPSTDR